MDTNTHAWGHAAELSAELEVVNAERFTARYALAQKVQENEDLLAINDALVTRLTELATRPLHRIVATRLSLNVLCVALAVKNSEFAAFPRFAVGHAATKVKALWAKATYAKPGSRAWIPAS